MVVILRKAIKIFGEIKEIPQYKPDEILLTREVRYNADLLDNELRREAKEINNDFNTLPQGIKKNEIEKWKWLGTKFNMLLSSVEHLEEKDIDNNLIWPAVGQYFIPDLKRGVDTKRSGSNKDHYRKCWLLATTPNNNWVKTWGGWDAFVDRAEQLVMSGKLMKALNEAFGSIACSLKTKDYQRIAKGIVKEYPTATKKPKIIDMIPSSEIQEAVIKIKNDLHKKEK